ncbi:FUSC family protein [Galbitalea sp. SE-J8]|uniref:FUSC family protein n=1 Tax=Galbitalea sp. SE-J8 TaxID=3054952 RepID=UPI00259C9F89|nr:FUSC family protein [Galbitalea sp. SE-J8]MDM4763766.1 FUSC family protein [Galbitalea sp. SE-J8]
MPGDADALRRLEHQVRLRVAARSAYRRVGASLPAIGQLLVAAGGAYAIAHYGLGHATPLLAVTVTLNALGLARDARPLRVAESVAGIVIGVALADVAGLTWGKGLWQLLIVLAVVLVVGRLVSAKPAFAIAAAVPSAIVLLLPVPNEGELGRTVDALIGGAIALLVTVLVPRDPRGAARRDARVMFGAIDEAIGALIDGLALGQSAPGALALERLRRTQSLVDDWTDSLDTAIAVSRLSPFLRGHLPELRRQERGLRAADLAARHLRVLARRVEFLVADRAPRPELAALLSEVRTAVRLLGESLPDAGRVEASGALLRELAPRLSPRTIVPTAPIPDAAVVLLVRPLVVDLLEGSGADVAAARALLPPL